MPTLYTYIFGFGLSIILTLVAFGLNFWHETSGHIFPSHRTILIALVALAIAQLLVQVILFLHLGQEKKPRWNLTAFIFALIVVGILVGGTLWIMNNLGHLSAQAGGQGHMREIYKGGEISPQTQND